MVANIRVISFSFADNHYNLKDKKVYGLVCNKILSTAYNNF